MGNLNIFYWSRLWFYLSCKLNIYVFWSTSELRVSRFKPSSKIFLLTVPMRYFFCGSFMFFLSCVCYVFVRVCLFVPCGHLLGKGWPLGSRFWCLTVSLALSHWYPGSGVVLGCIDFWSLHPYVLCAVQTLKLYNAIQYKYYIGITHTKCFSPKSC